MKLRIIILAIALVLLSFAGAYSDEGTPNQGTFEGDVGATAVVDNVSGNTAKFSEYQDMTKSGGLYGHIKLGYDSDNYWMKFSATDIGYKTQNYTLDGGMYGQFSYDLFYNQIIHNITIGALTPYSGVGSNVLFNGSGTPWSATNVPANTSAWNSFNYSISRNQYGGSFNLNMVKPFYVKFGLFREDRTGNMPFSNGDGIEVPAPVKYETDMYTGEIGYQAKPLFAAINFSYSDFTNQNQVLTINSIETPATTLTGAPGSQNLAYMTLPPNSSVYRLGFKGSLMLPLNSRFGVSLSNSQQRSTFDLANLVVGGVEAAGVAPGSSSQFTGRKEISNYNFSLTSSPLSFVDTKLFYQYYDSENKSDTVNQINGSPPPATIQVPLFSYKKNNYGVNLGFKLPEQFNLDAGYSYLDTNRKNRPDIPSTKDNVYSAELKWNGLDWLTPKIGYERLERLASYGPGYGLSNIAEPVNTPFFTMFDAAKQDRDTSKIALDVSPLSALNIGAAYKYKKSTFPSDYLGVQNTKTNEFEVYGDYTIGTLVKINAYFDLQNMSEYLLDYVYSGTVTSVTTTGATQYVWNLNQKDDTYEYGVGVDFYVVPKKVTVRLQYDYVDSDGSENFSFAFPGVINGVDANSATGPIGNPNLNDDVDSYHKSAFTFKTTYVVSKNLSLAAGASFERYKYNDYGLGNSYQYVNTANTLSGTGAGIYLTGAYANPSYTASVVFLTAAYKF